MLSIMDYIARNYDPAIGRFIQPDSIVSGAGNPQAWNRYAYTLNNPLRFFDPTGHTPCVGDNWDDGPRCLHQEGSILKTVVENTRYQKECAAGKRPECRGGRKGMVAFGVTTIVTASLVETAILGGGLASAADAALWKAGVACITSAACRLLTGAAGGAGNQLQRTPNEIGSWGVQQAGQKLPIDIGQFRVVDPTTGQVRIYDGNLISDPNTYVEVKTSLRGVVYATEFIKNQISFDANMPQKPLWVFVNARPSSPLMGLLQEASIFWHSLHP